MKQGFLIFLFTFCYMMQSAVQAVERQMTANNRLQNLDGNARDII
jgi:hypothetical protein